MKTNLLQNEILDKAKERAGRSQRAVAASPSRGRMNGNAPELCKPPARPARRRRPESARDAVTTVAAKIDVGLGNSLFIRGEGEGLSWDKGQPLTCVEGSMWVWSSRHAKEEVIFKLLVNDQVWCRGENIKVGPGRQVEVVPAF